MNQINKDRDISESEKFDLFYDDVFQKVKYLFDYNDYNFIGVSKSKAYRVITGAQRDFHVLLLIASFCGYEVDYILNKRIIK